MSDEQKYKLFLRLAVIFGGFAIGLWLGYFYNLLK